jgi:hypothetical protein
VAPIYSPPHDDHGECRRQSCKEERTWLGHGLHIRRAERIADALVEIVGEDGEVVGVSAPLKSMSL